MKPSQEFHLPARLLAPTTKYGPPAPSYGPPPADANPNQDGTDQTTTEQPTTVATTTTEENETEPPVNRLTKKENGKLVNGEEEEAEEIEVEADDSNKVSKEQPQENFYYIILPTGQLQKVLTDIFDDCKS